MSFGTGPEALVNLLRDNWQATRTGRADVPDIIGESDDPTLNSGVLPLRNREDVKYDTGKHDLIHCYGPEGGPFDIVDTGFKEQDVTETVQIDLEMTDRTDRATGERLSARQRMIGDRGSVATLGYPPYPGILGEVILILEQNRRGFAEYTKVSYEPIRVMLGNSNADVSLNVELEQIAHETAQP